MNKTFKVVFNKARGALMVVNEATSSVQKKETKTVIAAALTAMMAGVAGTAMADETTPPSPVSGVSVEAGLVTVGLPGNEGFSKFPSFVFGQGNSVKVVSTNSTGVKPTLRLALEAYRSGSPNGLVGSLLTLMGTPGTHIGIGGGYFGYDQNSTPVNAANSFIAHLFENKVPDQTGRKTLVTIGSESSEPLVIGFAGADVLLDTGNISQEHSPSTSTVTLLSGNAFGGGAGGVTVAISNSAKIDGNDSVLEITGHANAGLASAAGVALSTDDGQATSNIKNSTLTINTHHDANNAVSGVIAGVAAGGVALSLNGGTSVADVTANTTMELANGHGVLLAGGGVAGAISTSSNASSKAQANVGDDVEIKVGTADTNSLSVFGLVGGGIAAGYSKVADGTAKADANVNNVKITLNNAITPLSGDQKRKLIDAVRYAAYDGLSSELSAASGNLPQALDAWSQKVAESLSTGALSTNGVAVGVLGGGIAAAIQTEGDPETTANAGTKSTTISIQNGYNVGIVGGGAAIASGSDKTRV